MKKESLAIGGAVLATIGASLCCIGPLFFVALGLGAFSAATAFERGRPYLLGAAILALAFGFYRTYFRREACRTGEACDAKPVNRASHMALWVASLAVLAFALSPYYVGHIAAALIRSKEPEVTRAPEGAPAPRVPSTYLESVTVEVEGMDCTSCEIPIRAALEQTKGVRSADVSYERKNAKVVYDAKETDITEIKQAISSTGYNAK